MAKLWRCEKCGEEHEPQFTACWRCGAGAPSGHAPDELPDPESPIDLDVVCIGCEYNLRGLKPRGRCPECGRPVVHSLLAMSVKSPLDGIEGASAARLLVESVMNGSGYPRDAGLFLLDAWSRAVASADLRDGPRAGAIRMCWVVADAALEHFATLVDAVQALRAWGIKDCHALGRSLFVLIDLGLMERVALCAEDFPPLPLEAIFPPRRLSDVQV